MPIRSREHRRLLAVAIAGIVVAASTIGMSGDGISASTITASSPDVRHAPAAQVLTGVGWASPNWSGYAITAGPYTSVKGTWTVPAVRPSNGATYSSTWIGLDGFSNVNLIQVGTAQDFVDGVARYSTWWEILPAVAQPIEAVTVEPGDIVSAAIAKSADGAWTITIANTTTGGSFTTTQRYDGGGTSAEWIQEAPTISGRLSHLASYGTITFTTMADGRIPSLDPGDGGVMIQAGLRASIPTAADPRLGAFTLHATALPGASAVRARAVSTMGRGIRLTWTAAAPNGAAITGYRIYRRTGTTARTLVATLVSVLAWTDTKNPANRTSTYEVVAVNAVGTGPFSKAAMAYSR